VTDTYTAEEYQALFIYYCIDCGCDTDPSDTTGCCLWCDRKLKEPVLTDKGTILHYRCGHPRKNNRAFDDGTCRECRRQAA
jgi:hypothetical protein